MWVGDNADEVDIRDPTRLLVSYLARITLGRVSIMVH